MSACLTTDGVSCWIRPWLVIYLFPVPHLAPQPRKRVVNIVEMQKLLFSVLYMILLADKENLPFIYQEESKHSAGHQPVDYHSALTLVSHN